MRWMILAVLPVWAAACSGGGNSRPQVTVFAPAADLTIQVGELVEIRYADNDTDDQASTDVVAVPVTGGADILIAAGRPEGDGEPQTLLWDTTGVAPAIYVIEVRVRDGNAVRVGVAPGQLTVLPAPTLTAVAPGAIVANEATAFNLTGTNLGPGTGAVTLTLVATTGTPFAGSDTVDIAATLESTTSVSGVLPALDVGATVRARVRLQLPDGRVAESPTALVTIGIAPRVAGLARWTDTDANGLADVGDTVVVPFDRSIAADPGAAFSLPVSEDAFGVGATASPGPGADEVTIVLGTGARIRTRGTFRASRLTANSSSGIDVAAGAGDHGIRDEDGIPARASAPLDIVPAFREDGEVLEAEAARALAVGDLDRDGDVDAVFGGTPNTVWLNDGTGRFSDTGDEPGSDGTVDVHLADVNGDGSLDLILAHDDASNEIWLNDGAARFTSSGERFGAVNSGTSRLAVGDVDRDGDLDLVEGNAAAGNRVWLNDGNGRFSATAQILGGIGTADVVLGDLDRDGDLDLVAINVAGPGQVWRNDGTGTFEDTQQTLDGDADRVAALGDLDRDGDLDLVTNEAVWRNDGGGAFAATGQEWNGDETQRILLADIDGDGRPDLVRASATGANSVWFNDGTGRFLDSRQDLESREFVAAALADLDRDGDLDVIGATTAEEGRVFWGSLAGTWGSARFVDSGLSLPSGIAEHALAVGDVDKDGDPDVVLGTMSISQGTQVWLNDGSGAFEDTGQDLDPAGPTTAVALGDLDGDGDLDLVTGNFNQANRVWFNDGNGAFQDSGQRIQDPLARAPATWTLTLADLDRDGDLDLVTGVFRDGRIGGNEIWLNDGNGIFTDSGQRLGDADTSDVAVGDVDGDGDLDLVTAGRASGNRVWLNDGNAAFTSSLQSLGSAVTTTVSLGDVDRDGDLDIVAGNRGDVNRVWLNAGDGFFVDSGFPIGRTDDFTTALQIGDADGDGDVDLVLGHRGPEPRLLRNDGTGEFPGSGDAAGPRGLALMARLVDLDGDGDLDQVLGFNQTVTSVWLNE